MKKYMIFVLVGFFVMISAVDDSGALPFRPDASWSSGFGIDTPGGSGRHLTEPNATICKVVNLDDSGSVETDQSDGIVSGSLRYCLEDLDPTENYGKVIVFEVAGTIELNKTILVGDFTGKQCETKGSYITIAGQTAPPPGITLKNFGIRIERNCHDIVIQHLRFRTGDEAYWFDVPEGWTDQGGGVYSHSNDWSYCNLGGHPSYTYVHWKGQTLSRNTVSPSEPGLYEWGLADGVIYVSVGENPTGGGLVTNCNKGVADAYSFAHSFAPEHDPPWYPTKNVVIDHNSLAWGTDIQITNGASNLTVIDSIIAECLSVPYGPKGGHSKGMLTLGYTNGVEGSGGKDNAVVRNLFMRDHNRNPMISYGECAVANNMVFDWGINGIGVDDHSLNSFPVSISIVGNYLVPTSQKTAIQLQIGKPGSRLFLGDDNFVAGEYQTDPFNSEYINECHNWSNCQQVPEETKMAAREEAVWPPGFSPMTAMDARSHILGNAGAYPDFRDQADLDFIYEAANEIDFDISETTKATNADCWGADNPFDCCSGVGAGNCPDEVIDVPGPVYRALELPSDLHDVRASGYTALEEWLHDYTLQVEELDVACGDGKCEGNETCLTCETDCECYSLPTGDCGLIGLYHLDGNATDTSGLYNDGIVYGAAEVPGMFGTGFYFDGQDDYIDLDDDIGLSYTNELTGCAWFRVENLSKENQIFGDMTSYYLRFRPYTTNKIRALIYNGTSNYIVDTSNGVFDSDWHHACMIANGSRLFAYLDGVETEDNAFYSGDIRQNKVWAIGRISSNSFEGTIDEVALWNRALSRQEVEDLYNSSEPVSCNGQVYHPADLDESCTIEEDELILYIDDWYMDSTENPMSKVMEALGHFVHGTGSC